MGVVVVYYILKMIYIYYRACYFLYLYGNNITIVI